MTLAKVEVKVDFEEPIN